MPEFGSNTAVDLRDAARALTVLALETLESIMRGAGSDASRLAAAREILDRGHGKARAGVEDPDDDIRVVVRHFGPDGGDQ